MKKATMILCLLLVVFVTVTACKDNDSDGNLGDRLSLRNTGEENNKDHWNDNVRNKDNENDDDDQSDNSFMRSKDKLQRSQHTASRTS